MKILIVEDDVPLLNALRAGFTQQGIDAAVAQTYNDAWMRMALGTFSLFVLDITLPDGSGLDLCTRARAKGITTPILLLTARDAITDRVQGLEAGADDYLVKPFAFEELLARVRALTRRPPAIRAERASFEDLEIDYRKRIVRRAGRPIELTTKEFALLEVLSRSAGEVIDRATILSHVWDENYDPVSNALEVLIRRVREKIDDGFEPKLLHTVRGAGYRFHE